MHKYMEITPGNIMLVLAALLFISVLAGKAGSRFGVPAGPLAMLVHGGDSYIVPRGNTRLHVGDTVLLISRKEGR